MCGLHYTRARTAGGKETLHLNRKLSSHRRGAPESRARLACVLFVFLALILRPTLWTRAHPLVPRALGGSP